MAESRRVEAVGCFALALGLLLLPLIVDARFVLLPLWLAHPLLVCALLQWRQRQMPDVNTLLSQALALAAGYVALGVLLLWPLPLLHRQGSLLAALSVSAAMAVVLIVLWRTWPQFCPRDNAGAQADVEGSSEPVDAGSLLGLAKAGLILLMLSSTLAIAWPGLLPAAWWATAVFANALVAVVGQWLLQWRQTPPLASPRPMIRDRPEQIDWLMPDADAAAAAAPESPDEVESPEPASVDTAPAMTPERHLYQAARAGQIEEALQALAEGADPNAAPSVQDRDQRNLPMLAALLGDMRLLRELIARGVNLNATHAGLTPLLAATRDSWHGRPEAVMTLLANGADPRHADAEGNTPLHHAARSTDPAVVALLLDAGAQTGALNAEGISPLGIACAAANWRLAKYLLEHGAKAEPVEGQPALLQAAGGEDEPIGVQLLLRHKARVDARGAQGRTALLQACQAGNEDIVTALLDAGADRNGIDQAGISPLLEAARSGHLGVVLRLAPSKPDAHACDEQGRNALCLVCERGGSPELVKQLIALGVDSEQCDQTGRRAVDFAIAAGRWPLVAVLDPDYPLPASMVESGEALTERTPRELLKDALLANRLESAEALARLGVWPDAEALGELLLAFSRDQDDSRIAWLLRHGASTDARPGAGDSVMFQLLADGGQARVALRAVLAAGCGVGGRGGLARFLSACLATQSAQVATEHEALALDLMSRGADPFAGDDAPPLHHALSLGWMQVLRALLTLGVDPNCRDSKGRTALHVAASLGAEAALRELIRFGAQPGRVNAEGQTPLGIALTVGRPEQATWLDWRQWSLPGRPLRNSDLPAAAAAGDAAAVARLLALGLPVDAVDAQGCSALLRAAGGGHEAVVDVLLAASANTAVAARTGATPLSAAISMRQVGVVERLLAAGADVNQTLPGDISPLMLASALGLPDLVDRLLSHGADALAVDDQGMDALHCAALFAFSSRDRQRATSLFSTLLAARLPVDQHSASGYTPLLLLLGARADAGVTCDEDVLLAVLDRLLGALASVHVQDQRGLSPLHLAAMHGLSRVVQRLLREGADRNLRDGLGRTPHDLAVMRGYVDVAAEFDPARSPPSMARFLREPPSKTE